MYPGVEVSFLTRGGLQVCFSHGNKDETLDHTVNNIQSGPLLCMCNYLLSPSSSVKAAHSPVVSKIDNRLEQYTSAAQVSMPSTVMLQKMLHSVII